VPLDFGDRLIAASQDRQLAMSVIKDDLIPVSGLRFTDQVDTSWSPQPDIVLDPAVHFGEPCIHHTHLPKRNC